MSRYDRIPELKIDWKKDYPGVVDDWCIAYFKLRKHCADEVFRAEVIKGIAILGWAIAFASTGVLATLYSLS